MGSESGEESAPRRRALPAFGVALGHQLRRVRESAGATAEALAGMSRFVGLHWDRSTVTRIELGQRQVTAAELFALAVLYGKPVAELLPNEPCQVTPELAGTPEAFRRILTGPSPRGGFQFGAGFWNEFDRAKSNMIQLARDVDAKYPGVPGMEILDAARHAKDEATTKAAKKLNVEPLDVAIASVQTFSRSLTEERDARVGDAGTMRARQAKRGHVTRQLLDELRPALAAIQAARHQEEETNG